MLLPQGEDDSFVRVGEVLEDVVQESPWDSQAGGVALKGQGAPVWLAAYTRPRHEDKVKQYCEERGIEVFLPTFKSWRRWSDRKVQITAPLFPSYAFLQLDALQRRRAMQAPGFRWFVHNRTGPVRVSVEELHAIRGLLVSGLAFDPLPQAELGDEVEIVTGAMRGCRGHLLNKDEGAGRIVLSLSAVQGLVRVTLPDPSWIAPVLRGKWKAPAQARDTAEFSRREFTVA
jgi:transcription antitermination factor NusG